MAKKNEISEISPLKNIMSRNPTKNFPLPQFQILIKKCPIMSQNSNVKID